MTIDYTPKAGAMDSTGITLHGWGNGEDVGPTVAIVTVHRGTEDLLVNVDVRDGGAHVQHVAVDEQGEQVSLTMAEWAEIRGAVLDPFAGSGSTGGREEVSG